MALKQEELFKLDLYNLLELEVNCSLQDIKRAFRKKALKCHPDKNPDNPNAAQLFHQLSCALEILSDESARAAYDRVLKARKAAEIRNQQLDSKRKKLKEDLEERERKASKGTGSNFSNDELKLKAEVERLRKEGSRLLQEEISKVQEEVKSSWSRKQNFEDKTDDCTSSKCLNIHWQADKGDVDNGGYSSSVLHKILSTCGDVSALIISNKKKGRAIVEFKTSIAAMKALDSKLGLPNKPLVFEKISNSSKKPTATCSNKTEPKEQETHFVSSQTNPMKSQMKAEDLISSKWNLGTSSSQLSYDLLESDVLMRLRQMERLKRSVENDN